MRDLRRVPLPGLIFDALPGDDPLGSDVNGDRFIVIDFRRALEALEGPW